MTDIEVQSIDRAIYRYDGSRSLKRTCKINDDTALWMARMCVGEGGLKCSVDKAAAMLWALMNRWMLWDKRHVYPSYKSLMRAFSQPINPRWQRGGDLAIKWEDTTFASPAKLKRRERICSYQWSEIPKRIRDAVSDFQSGKLFPPEILTTLDRPRITNWASLKSTPMRFPWGVDIEGDWFFEDAGILDGCVVVDTVSG